MQPRVEWREIRDQEPYLVIADLTPKGWEFWDRSSWEVRWYQMTSTPQLIAKATQILKGSARRHAA